MTPDLTVLTFRHGPFWNFTYLVGVPGGDSAVIDPGGEIDALCAAAREHEMGIRHAVLTHAHHDHFSSLHALVQRTGAATLVHHLDAPALHAENGPGYAVVEHGHEIVLANATLQLLHTPGHTEGSICISAAGHLFTGDTLMTGSPGRHGPFPGAAEALATSLAALAAVLPPDVIVHPGHDAGPAPTARLSRALSWVVP